MDVSLDNFASTITTANASSSTLPSLPPTETFKRDEFSFLQQIVHILDKVETSEDPQEVKIIVYYYHY